MDTIKTTKQTDMFIKAIDYLYKSEELAKCSLLTMYEREDIEEEISEIEAKSDRLKDLYRDILIYSIYQNFIGGCSLA